jgi:hypothetical protein
MHRDMARRSALKKSVYEMALAQRTIFMASSNIFLRKDAPIAGAQFQNDTPADVANT